MALNRPLLLLLLLLFSLHPLDLLSLSRISFTQHVFLLLSSHLKIIALLLYLSLAKLMVSNLAISDFPKLSLSVYVQRRGLVRDLMVECRRHRVLM